MIKNIYSIQWKISGQLCFSGQAQVAQKSWTIKIYIQYSENIQGKLCVQGKRKLLKILDDKKYIFNTVKIFRAIWSCSKILSGKKYFHYSGKFHGNCFSGKGENFFNTVYSGSKGNYRKVPCQGEHNKQGTSPPWVNKQGNYRICLQRHL